jgi:hypothetical protein
MTNGEFERQDRVTLFSSLSPHQMRAIMSWLLTTEVTYPWHESESSRVITGGQPKVVAVTRAALAPNLA